VYQYKRLFRDGVGSDIQESLASFPLYECASCHQQRHVDDVGSKTGLQLNLPISQCRCHVMQVEFSNAHKTVVIAVYKSIEKHKTSFVGHVL